MKIVRKDLYSTCEFGELKAGDVFVEDSKFIQMKTEEIAGSRCECYNSVCLTTGDMYYIDAGTKVKRVHAELTITNIEEAG